MELTQFFALLSKSSAAASLFTVGAVAILILIMLIIAYIRRSPFHIGIGYFQVSLGPPENKVPFMKYNEHYLQKFRTFLTSKEKEISKLNSEIFERQMNFCDDKLNVIRGMFMEEYRALLSKKVSKGTDVRSHECYRHYMMLVDLMLSEALKESTFKRSMKQNHLLDLTLETWEDFINDKVSITFSLLNRFYDDSYPDTSLVSRSELDESNERLFEKIKPIITSMYRKAREITVEVTTKTLLVQKEIDEECRNGNFDIICLDEDRKTEHEREKAKGYIQS